MVEKIQELWLAKVAKRQHVLRAVAGELFELKATDLIPHESDDRSPEWRIAGTTLRGAALKWTPRSPGVYGLELRAARRVLRRQVIVGLRPSDIVKRAKDLDSYFCFIVPNAHKVHFFPLLDKGGGGGAKAREGVKREIKDQHPAFSRLLAAQTRIYRDRVLPHPFVDPKSFRPGLYAVCSNDLCYLGSEQRLNAIAGSLQKSLRLLSTRRTGRGAVLKVIEKTLADLSPAAYEYSNAVQFPMLSLKRRGAFAPERFACGVVSSVVAATLNFARDLGVDSGRPGDGLTTLITFNSANGSLSTSMFDSVLGLTRQVMSGFETGRGIAELTDLAGLTGFGTDPGTDGTTDPTGGDLGTFGRGGGRGNGGLTDLFGDLFGGDSTGGSGGVSSFSRFGGRAAMDGEGGDASPGDFPGYDEGGKYWVNGSDGSKVGFGYGPDGNPAPAAVDEVDGTTVLYGDVTVWTFDPEPIDPEPVDPEPVDPEPTDPQPTDPEPTDPEPTDPEPTDPEPPGTDPAEMPAPDDGSGGGGGGPDDGTGGGGGGPTFGTSRGGRPVPLGVFTRGGGYTDPAPDDGGGDGGGGGVVVIPGGGLVDPVDPDTPGGQTGFAGFGGYNPGFGPDLDPLIYPTAGDYSATGTASVSRTVTDRQGVRVETHGGVAMSGASLDGLVGGCTFSAPVGGLGRGGASRGTTEEGLGGRDWP